MATTPHKRVGGGGMSPARASAALNGATAALNNGSSEDGGDPKLHHHEGGPAIARWGSVVSSSPWRIALLRRVRSLRSDGRERMRLFVIMVGIALVTVTLARDGDGGFLRRGGSGGGSNGPRPRPSFPRVVGYYPSRRRGGPGPGGRGFHFERLDVVPPAASAGRPPSAAGIPSFVAHDALRMKMGRTMDFSKEEAEFQKSLESSRKYKRKMRDPLHEGDCAPMRWWQETSFPSCNKLHELIDTSTFSYLARGGYNDVFKVKDVDRRSYVLKVLKGPYDTEFTDRNLDRVRRDSLIMERATASPYVMDIHGYCGFAQVTTYSREGDLDGHIWHPEEPLSREYKLKLATQVAMALTAVHDTDGDGRSAMSHGDFATKQYIKVGDVYKLNDFNRGRFIRWNEKKKEPCTYTIGKNDGKFRAPEEYAYTPESAKIDVWALGSIFFNILTGSSVWQGYDEKEAQQALIDGKLPPMKDEYKDSDDPIDRVLLKAIEMCYVYDPKERPDAGVVSEYLRREAKRLGVEVDAAV